MDIPESKVHSFIVKLWVEDSGDETGKVFWRGYVTHVPSGERCYLHRLNNIIDFIVRYLGEIGDKPEPGSRFRIWLRHFCLSLIRQL